MEYLMEMGNEMDEGRDDELYEEEYIDWSDKEAFMNIVRLELIEGFQDDMIEFMRKHMFSIGELMDKGEMDLLFKECFAEALSSTFVKENYISNKVNTSHLLKKRDYKEYLQSIKDKEEMSEIGVN